MNMEWYFEFDEESFSLPITDNEYFFAALCDGATSTGKYEMETEYGNQLIGKKIMGNKSKFVRLNQSNSRKL